MNTQWPDTRADTRHGETLTVTWLADASNRDRLAELVHALTGRRLARTTMLRWMRGERRMDACAEALIAVLLTPVKDIRKADLELRKK